MVVDHFPSSRWIEDYLSSLPLQVLLDKKYALPYRVVDALVDHFLSFRKEDRTLPVVWHQSLLCFVQRCVGPSLDPWPPCTRQFGTASGFLVHGALQ